MRDTLLRPYYLEVANISTSYRYYLASYIEVVASERGALCAGASRPEADLGIRGAIRAADVCVSNVRLEQRHRDQQRLLRANRAGALSWDVEDW